MARQTVVHITDDLDRGSEADTTRLLGWDGYMYILDLTNKHDKELLEQIQPYLDAAHKRVRIPSKFLPKDDVFPEEVKPVKAGKRRGGATAKANAVADKRLRAKIRQWGRENGWKVSTRGILPADLTAAYREAHKS